jgi:hypothetical protein
MAGQRRANGPVRGRPGSPRGERSVAEVGQARGDVAALARRVERHDQVGLARGQVRKARQRPAARCSTPDGLPSAGSCAASGTRCRSLQCADAHRAAGLQLLARASSPSSCTLLSTDSACESRRCLRRWARSPRLSTRTAGSPGRFSATRYAAQRSCGRRPAVPAAQPLLARQLEEISEVVPVHRGGGFLRRVCASIPQPPAIVERYHRPREAAGHRRRARRS